MGSQWHLAGQLSFPTGAVSGSVQTRFSELTVSSAGLQDLPALSRASWVLLQSLPHWLRVPLIFSASSWRPPLPGAGAVWLCVKILLMALEGH